MKTGNTGMETRSPSRHLFASMEPGHEDREYRPGHVIHETVDVASMEPGHEDREYWSRRTSAAVSPIRLNGARS